MSGVRHGGKYLIMDAAETLWALSEPGPVSDTVPPGR